MGDEKYFCDRGMEYTIGFHSDYWILYERDRSRAMGSEKAIAHSDYPLDRYSPIARALLTLLSDSV